MMDRSPGWLPACVRGTGVAAAPLRLLRTVAGRLAPGELLINANHFLFLPPEVTTPFDAYGDPIGLTLAGGVIETPPQQRRACLVHGPDGPAIERLGFADLQIETDVGAFMPHPPGPPAQTESGTAFALFHGSTQGATPPGTGWDVAFVGRHAVAMSPAGGLSIPRAGCVLRCANPSEAAALAARPLTYRLGAQTQGVQAGPVIVEDGQITEDARNIFREEHMRAEPDRADLIPISPHAWAADWHETLGRSPVGRDHPRRPAVSLRG